MYRFLFRPLQNGENPGPFSVNVIPAFLCAEALLPEAAAAKPISNPLNFETELARENPGASTKTRKQTRSVRRALAHHFAPLPGRGISGR
jgi:hypothetical protein